MAYSSTVYAVHGYKKHHMHRTCSNTYQSSIDANQYLEPLLHPEDSSRAFLFRSALPDKQIPQIHRQGRSSGAPTIDYQFVMNTACLLKTEGLRDRQCAA